MSKPPDTMKLNAANRAIMDEIKTYMLTGPASPSVTKKVLAELEDHLLLAQKDGKTFEDVFGKDPKAFCDELIREIPRQTLWQRAGLLLYALLILMMWKLGEGLNGHLRLPLYDTGVYAALSLLIFGLFWMILRKTSFKPCKEAYWAAFSLGILAFAVYFLMTFAGKSLFPQGSTLELEGAPARITGMLAAAVLIFALFYEPISAIAKKMRKGP